MASRANDNVVTTVDCQHGQYVVVFEVDEREVMVLSLDTAVGMALTVLGLAEDVQA